MHAVAASCKAVAGITVVAMVFVAVDGENGLGESGGVEGQVRVTNKPLLLADRGR